MKLRQTSTTYTAPHRPLPIRAFNFVGRNLSGVGFGKSLQAETLMRAARRKTKLVDFGTPDVSEPLGVLTSSINREARLHPFGRFVASSRLVGLLANRLRCVEFANNHPDIEQTPLPPVILITGLQRTGTTLLHRLLAMDPEVRALRSWEAITPVPLIGHRDSDEQRRVKIARRAERALKFLAPDFFAIHPVEAQAPEEDVLLLDYSLLSTVPESMMHLPTYAAWVEQRDNTPAYRLLISMLKLLSWQQPAPFWVLKSPHHLEFLDIILELFPQVTVVQTHRDPAVCLPSFCSMMAHSRGVFSDHVDPLEIGRTWLAKTSRMVAKGLEVRRRTAAATTDRNFLDIYYDELLRDPLGQVERIYALAGMRLSAAAVARMEESLRINVQHRYGVHRYGSADFGLNRETVYEIFAEYLNHFDIPACRAA